MQMKLWQSEIQGLKEEKGTQSRGLYHVFETSLLFGNLKTENELFNGKMKIPHFFVFLLKCFKFMGKLFSERTTTISRVSKKM